MRKLASVGWLPWMSMGLLALFCCILAFVQYRWIGEIVSAENSRLRGDLRSRLSAVSSALHEQVSRSARAMIPSEDEIASAGLEGAYAARFRAAAPDARAIFGRVAVALPVNGGIQLLMLEPETGGWRSAGWPPEWSAVRSGLERRVAGLGPPPMESDLVVDIPRFASREGFGVPSHRAPGGEQDWLLLELDEDYVLRTLLPQLLNRYPGQAELADYDVDVTDKKAHATLYHSFPVHKRITEESADVAVGLLNVRVGGPGGPGRAAAGPEPISTANTRWLLLARSRAGSLEVLVRRTRQRNLAISGAILLIIMASGAMLVRFSRRASMLAEAQVNFVAGVSHEFLTPLTVIRTAAYNLRKTTFRREPEQLARYGKLIEDEAEKLRELVAQVLQFASARAGHPIREREVLALEELINGEVVRRRSAAASAGAVIEMKLQPDLPPIWVDRRAFEQAIGNLLDNALKYGTGMSAQSVKWIGVYAERDPEATQTMLRIRVVDKGPGIPPEEQRRIFEPFFRGRRAVADQAHGTGLGLNLVKTTVEAHGGSVSVTSEPGEWTEFTLRVPAAPAAIADERTYSAG